MGIGTSDGRYYPNEMEQTLHEQTVADVTDPLPPNTKYDDSPTDLQKARDGSVYNNLKQNEGEMENNLQNYTPEAPEERPVTNASELPEGLRGLPRITVTPKEPEENVTATGPRGFWNQITGADGLPRYKLFPERMLDHLTDSAQRFGDLLKGDAKLPLGMPGAAEMDDPEAIRNLHAVVDMAGFLTFGPGKDAALEASPVTFKSADRALSSVENIVPQNLRGGMTPLGSLEHANTPLEERIAQIMRPRSRAEAAAAGPEYRGRYTNPHDSVMTSIEDALRDTGGANRLDNALVRMHDGLDNILSGPAQSIESLVARMRGSQASREAAMNENPRGWGSVEGGATSPGSTGYADLPGMSSKTVKFANKEGKNFYIDATQYGDHLAIGMIGSMTKDGFKMGINTNFSNSMGISGMRTVLKQLQKEFPGSKTISGFRVTGARGAKGGGRAIMKLPGN